MPKFGGRQQHDQVGPAPREEDPVERQYRYLLRTAPADALEAAHAEALGAVAEEVRRAVLETVQEALVAGGRLTTEDREAISRLVTAGERRTPGAFLWACPSSARRRLAEAVVGSEAVFGLFGGYAAWDGADPEPTDVGVDQGGPRGVDGADPAALGKYLAQSHSHGQSNWGTGWGAGGA